MAPVIRALRARAYTTDTAANDRNDTLLALSNCPWDGGGGRMEYFVAMWGQSYHQ